MRIYIKRIATAPHPSFQVKGLLQEGNAHDASGGSPKDQIVPLFKHPLLKLTIITIALFVLQQLVK